MDRRISPPFVRQVIEQGSKRLQAAGIDSPKLCAEVLLASVLDVERAWLVWHFEHEVTSVELARYQRLIERCARHEPVAYLVGQKEFFGRSFWVSKDVLIPRPETEELAEVVMDCWEKDAALSILDIGTGSGVLAVTLAAHFQQSRVVALDLSGPALAVAGKNAAAHEVSRQIVFCQASLYFLPFFPSSFDCIVTNPPYIGADEFTRLPSSVAGYEPRLALVSGPTGLECYQSLSRSAFELLRPGGIFFAEIGWQQKEGVLQAFAHWAQARVVSDLAGKDRILIARK